MTNLQKTAAAFAAIATIAGAGTANAQHYSLQSEPHQVYGTPTYNCIRAPFEGIVAFQDDGHKAIVVPRQAMRYDRESGQMYVQIPTWYNAADADIGNGQTYEPAAQLFYKSIGRNATVPYTTTGNGSGGLDAGIGVPSTDDELKSWEVLNAISECGFGPQSVGRPNTDNRPGRRGGYNGPGNGSNF